MLTSQVQGRKVWKRQRNPVKREETFLLFYFRQSTLTRRNKFTHFLLSSSRKSVVVRDLIQKHLPMVGLISTFKILQAFSSQGIIEGEVLALAW